MKKVLATILAFLYLSASTGMTVQLHYCMGKLADWSVWGSQSDQCGKCGMDKEQASDSGCCKDEMKAVKVDDVQKASVATNDIPRPAASDVTVFASHSIAITVATNICLPPQDHAPPRSHGPSLCELYSVFRI